LFVKTKKKKHVEVSAGSRKCC